MRTNAAPPATAAERIGRNVAAELTRHRVSRAAAAAELDLSTESLRQRITGAVPFREDEVTALALMLGIDADTLMPEHLRLALAVARPYLDRVPARDAGHLGVALAVAFPAAFVLWALALGYGRFILWLAGIDSPPHVAAALVGVGLLGVPLYALVVIVEEARKRRARRAIERARQARVIAAITDLREQDLTLRGIR